MAFFAGKNQSLTWSATQQPIDKQDIEDVAEIVDTTNALSGGQGSNLFGVEDSNLSAEGFYNGSMGIGAGTSINFTIAVGGGGPSFTVPYRVSSIKLSAAVRNQAWRFALQAKSNGAFTLTL